MQNYSESLKNILANISNKYTSAPCLYTYGNAVNNLKDLCVFFRFGDIEDSEDRKEFFDIKLNEVKHTFIYHYGNDDFAALSKISTFIKFAEQEKIQSDIYAFWQNRVNDYIENYLNDYDGNIKEGFFFTFLPKSI